MDNQYENGFYGYEPQRPLTEKQTASPDTSSVPEQEPFEPQKPLLHETENDRTEAVQQAFDPVQHRPVYGDDRFAEEISTAGASYQAPPASPVAGTPPYQAPPVPPASGTPAGYSPAAGSQRSYAPLQNYSPMGSSGYAYREPPKPKIKPNTALMVVIIVMGAMLTAGMFGMVGYSIYHAQSKEGSRSQQEIIEQIPGLTLPDNGGNGGAFQVPAVTEPTLPEHKETDYSKKANKDYEGLTLNDKPEDAEDNSDYSAEYAFKEAEKSVVSVLCFTDKTDDNSKAVSQGSGIVISADGFVITNSHVVGNSKTAYAVKVITADGKEYKTGVVGFDARTDLAVLKMEGAKELNPAVFGNSDQIKLGEDLIVIGNPGGIEYRNSMTKGIVSAVNRDASGKNIVKYIQTDAAINPGNSGGPAVNNFGQVIGVASAKIADEKYEGMGFCIPSVQVKQIIDSLMRNGYVEGRVRIGISGVAVSAAEAESYSVPHGIVVGAIAENGPCDKTDLQEEDIITALDGKAITSFSEIYQVLETHKPGDKVKLSFYRQTDGKNHEIEITLQEDK